MTLTLSVELFNRQQVETGRQAVLTHPVNSALWEVPVMRVERWDTYVTHYDLGAYGCNQKSESVPMKAVSTHDALAKALALKREGAFNAGWCAGGPLCLVSEDFGAVMFHAAQRIRENPADMQTGFEVLIANKAEGEGNVIEPCATGIVFDDNLGHPGNDELARRLRLSGASKDVIKAVKGLRCRTCQSCQRPASARPAKPVPVLNFNDLLGIDVIHVEDCCCVLRHP